MDDEEPKPDISLDIKKSSLYRLMCVNLTTLARRLKHIDYSMVEIFYFISINFIVKALHCVFFIRVLGPSRNA